MIEVCFRGMCFLAIARRSLWQRYRWRAAAGGGGKMVGAVKALRLRWLMRGTASP